MKKLFLNTPLLLLFVFFSINGFSQADTAKQTTDHPLLDKYYPRPKTEPVPKKPVVKSTGVEQKNVIVTPKNKTQLIVENRLYFPTPVQRPETAVAPVKKDSVLVEVESPVFTPVSKGVVITDAKLVPVSDSAKITKPVMSAAIATPPSSPKPQSRIEPGYQRNRLGSSSPLYNTYEKNAKGAGSVTTLPKR